MGREKTAMDRAASHHPKGHISNGERLNYRFKGESFTVFSDRSSLILTPADTWADTATDPEES